MRPALCHPLRLGAALFLAWAAVALTSSPRLSAAENIDLKDGLLLHLPLSGNVRDQSSFRREVETHGRVEVRDGALYFPRHQTWLELPHLPLNDRPFAMAFWIKPTGAHAMYGLVEQRDSNARTARLSVQHGSRFIRSARLASRFCLTSFRLAARNRQHILPSPSEAGGSELSRAAAWIVGKWDAAP